MLASNYFAEFSIELFDLLFAVSALLIYFISFDIINVRPTVAYKALCKL